MDRKINLDQLEKETNDLEAAVTSCNQLLTRRSENEAVNEEIMAGIGEGKFNLEDSRVMKRLSDARLQLDLIKAGAEGLDRKIRHGKKAVFEGWDFHARLLRKWKKAKREELVQQLAKALGPFCEAGTNRAAKLAEKFSAELHVFYQLNRKIPTNSPSEMMLGNRGEDIETADLLLNAKIFLRPAKAAAKEFGLQ